MARKSYAPHAVMERSVISRANDLLVNRREILAPFPLEIHKVYEALFTEEELAAIRLLQNNIGSILSMRAYVDLAIPMNDFVPSHMSYKPLRVDKIRVMLTEPAPMPDRYSGEFKERAQLQLLPPAMRDALYEWAYRWTVLDAERVDILAKLDRLFHVCNTTGQVKRLWPNIAQLAEVRIKDQLAAAKVRSRLPALVVDTRDAREWSAEALEWVDQRIAEALCLPTIACSSNLCSVQWDAG